MRRERPTKGDDLLAAYVDGVGELTPSERRRVELYLADGPAARDEEAATRALLGTLRELPPAHEPDLTKLERSILESVGDTVPRPWWKRWQVVVPGLAVAGAATIAILALRSEPRASEPTPIVHAPAPQPAPAEPEDQQDTFAVYLDGLDLELAADAADEIGDALDELTYAGLGLDAREPAEHPAGRTPRSLLGNLGWVDELDEAALQQLEHVLEKAKGT